MLKEPFEHISRLYPDVVFIFCDIQKASITDIVSVPTLKIFRDNIRYASISSIFLLPIFSLSSAPFFSSEKIIIYFLVHFK